MPLRNAAFISYRHGQYGLMRQFVEDLYAALCNELEPMLGQNVVYLDKGRLRGGDFYNQELARNLYESATMILIYTPTYFEEAQPYCTCEFLAMENIEKERLRLLGLEISRRHGLIIPIVLRGTAYLPETIRSRRQYHNFENFHLGERRMSHHPRFAPLIREIAAYVYDRFYELRNLPEEVFAHADEFCMPSVNEAAEFLNTVNPYRPPFPGRGRDLCGLQVAN